MDLYLRIAPELHLKRLVVGGLADKVFEINRCFRNEGLSPRHNPEFTSLELYEAYADYTAMMALTEELVAHVAEAASADVRIGYGGTEIDLSPPWPRRTMAELVLEATGVDFLAIDDAAAAREAAAKLGCAMTGSENWGQALEAAFAARVEDTLIQPIHVTGFPRDISPLAKARPRPTRGSSSGSRPTSTAGRSPTPSPSSTTRTTSAPASRRRCRRAPPATRRRSRSTRIT